MRRLIRRLTKTSPAEIWFRSAQRVRIARDEVRVATGGDRWQRPRLLSILRPQSVELAAAHDALSAEDWQGADAALRSHFINRPSRFVIGPRDRRQIASTIRGRHPASADDAVRRANDLLEGRHDLLGYQGLAFGTSSSDIDWHLDPVHGRRAPVRFWTRVPYLDPQWGDHKIIWELNRHQHWVAFGRAAWLTRDQRYATAFATELESWLRANPPLIGINWSSMLEIAFRSISWLWALHLFPEFDTGPESSPFVDLLVGLERQLDHIAQHLSLYFSPNTHLLGEGLALYVAGRALPELTGAQRWESVGRQILIRQAQAQIHADGGHAELSTHYHRYAFDFYLLALGIARRTDDLAAAGAFADVSAQLATFCRAMADDDGRLATIGDDDGGMLFPICGRKPVDVRDSLAIASALLERSDLAVGEPPEEAIWMLGDRSPSSGSAGELAVQRSRLFSDSGYAVLRSDRAHSILDVGPHGFLNGGHAHADALSLVLSVDGRPLLIDAGTSTYTMDPERRDRFRSTAMHNTVLIDGRPQSIPDGPFHWASRARARVDLWRSDRAFDYIEASHDGYLPVLHRRAVLRDACGLWLVADHILGSGAHEAVAHWHFGPDWQLEAPDWPHASVRHRDGTRAAIASTAAARRALYADSEGLGWCAPVYGQLVPALTLRFSQTSDAPFSLIAAVAGDAWSEDLTARPVEIALDKADEWHRSGAHIISRSSQALVLFATPGASGAEGPSRRSVQRMTVEGGDFITDARAAILHLSHDQEPETLTVIEGTLARWSGAGAFQVSPLPGEQDLHLDGSALRRLSHVGAARPVG
jgi:Heparinase II/III-like protein/Heparinase II/III N-terminus